MASIYPQFKRVIVGKELQREELARERLPKRFAIPAYAADTWSSIAYAPDQIIMTLAFAGAGALAWGPWVAIAVALVMTVVVIGHAQIIAYFPDGGGDFAITRANLGERSGRIVGASLLVDYVLTVAVSVSQAAAFIGGPLNLGPSHRAALAASIIVVLTAISLRGVRTSSRLLAWPVYAFMASVGLLVLIGAIQACMGTLGTAPSAGLTLTADEAHEAGLTMIGGALLIFRAFSSGSVALSGIKAVANGVQNFRRPKVASAQLTLVLTALISMIMLCAVMWLARATGVTVLDTSQHEAHLDTEAIHAASHVPVLTQLAQAIIPQSTLVLTIITLVSALILCVAASTAFHGFPMLASILAHESFVPRAFAARGDRLAYSNGIIALGLCSLIAVVATGGQVRELIHMYLVGVFVSLAFGHMALARHVHAQLRVSTGVRTRRDLTRARTGARVGAVVMGCTLVIVIFSKATSGAIIPIVAILVLSAAMGAISRYYATYRAAIDMSQHTPMPPVPSAEYSFAEERSRALVVLQGATQPSYAATLAALREPHSYVEAMMVATEDVDIRHTTRLWHAWNMPVNLRVEACSKRDTTAPIREYVRALSAASPETSIVVYVSHYSVGHWWQAPLHNHVARRLRASLADLPAVEVRTVSFTPEANKKEHASDEPSHTLTAARRREHWS